MDVFSLSLIALLGFITGHQRRQIRLLWVEVGRIENRTQFRDDHLDSRISLLGKVFGSAQTRLEMRISLLYGAFDSARDLLRNSRFIDRFDDRN